MLQRQIDGMNRMIGTMLRILGPLAHTKEVNDAYAGLVHASSLCISMTVDNRDSEKWIAMASKQVKNAQAVAESINTNDLPPLAERLDKAATLLLNGPACVSSYAALDAARVLTQNWKRASADGQPLASMVGDIDDVIQQLYQLKDLAQFFVQEEKESQQMNDLLKAKEEPQANGE